MSFVSRGVHVRNTSKSFKAKRKESKVRLALILPYPSIIVSAAAVRQAEIFLTEDTKCYARGTRWDTIIPQYRRLVHIAHAYIYHCACEGNCFHYIFYTSVRCHWAQTEWSGWRRTSRGRIAKWLRHLTIGHSVTLLHFQCLSMSVNVSRSRR
jgi:hypothetical protein